MSKITTQASSFSASYKQTPKFKSFLLKEHINEGSRWPDNKSADNKSGDSISDVHNQSKPVDYSCVLEKESNQQHNNLIDYSSMPPLVAIDHSLVQQQGSKTTSSQIPLKKRSKQYEGLWTPTSVGDLPLSPVTLPESPQSLSLLEDSDNDKSTELTHSTQQLDNSSDSTLSESTGKLTDLSITNYNLADPFYSPTSPGNPSQQYIYSYLQYPQSSYPRNIEYPVAVQPLPISHRPQYIANHSNYNPKPTKASQYFFPLGGPTPSRKVAEELKATQLALFRDTYRLSAPSPHAFAPYRKPNNTSMDRFKDMSHFRTENPSSQPSHAPKDEEFDLNNSTYNVCHESNRPYMLPQRPSAFKKSLPSFLDPDCSSSHPKASVNIEKIEPSNDFMRQKPISEWTFSEVVTFMSRKQDTMNMKFNFTPLSGITGRELLSFSPEKLNVVAPGRGKELFIVLRDLHLERRYVVSDSPRSPYEISSLTDDISKSIHFNNQQKLLQRDRVTSRDNLHPDFMVRSPQEYKHSVSLENVHSPLEYNPREHLVNVQIANDFKQRESVNRLHNSQEYKPREILENVQIQNGYKQSPRDSFENLRSPRENYESLRSPLEYKPRDSIDNLKSSQDDRHNYLRYLQDGLSSNETYKDMKFSPSSTHMSNHYPEHFREGYQVPLDQYKVPLSSPSGSHQSSHQSSHLMPSAARKYFAPLHSPEYGLLNNSSTENRSNGDGEVPKTTPAPPVKRGPGRPRKPENELKRKKKRTGRLWEFVRNLLHDPETCPSLVKWENAEEGIFRFVQAEKVAKIWGMRKHNTDMNYEKLSRAMRYYYKGGVFEIVAGRRLVYKFGKAAKNWKPSDPNFPNFQR